MLENLRIWVGAWLFKRELDGILKKQADMDRLVNQRVMAIIAKMDPFEPLMKEYNGIFSTEHEHPEDTLDEPGKLGMRMWAYGVSHDPHFKRLTQYIMDTQANETLKRAPVTEARIQYGRAQISSMILFRKEIGRLSLAYEDTLAGKGREEFNSEKATE